MNTINFHIVHTAEGTNLKFTKDTYVKKDILVYFRVEVIRERLETIVKLIYWCYNIIQRVLLYIVSSLRKFLLVLYSYNILNCCLNRGQNDKYSWKN